MFKAFCSRFATVKLLCPLGFAVLIMVLPAGAGTVPIPLDTGTQWVYEGKVRWTQEGSASVKSKTIRWVCEVMEGYGGPTARAAVVRGFPDELCWYEPTRSPGFCVLLCLSNRVYRLRVGDEKGARILARQLTDRSPAPEHTGEAFLEWPLTVGSRWGDEAPRQDSLYCWHVERGQAQKLPVTGIPHAHAREVFTIAYRTVPDHQIFEVAPGLGIVRFVYDHHGTVAAADMRLVSFSRRPDPKAQR